MLCVWSTVSAAQPTSEPDDCTPTALEIGKQYELEEKESQVEVNSLCHKLAEQTEIGLDSQIEASLNALSRQ